MASSLKTPGYHERETTFPSNEYSRSTRGQDLSTFAATIPEGALDDPRRAVAETAMLSVRERSSFQLRDCFGRVEPAPTLNADGRYATRSSLLDARRKQLAEENAAIGKNPKSTMPTGRQPGAPGKNPDARRFTHHDVERMRMPR